MWTKIKSLLGLENQATGPRFVIHQNYQLDIPFTEYDSRRPFRILSFLERRKLLVRGALRRPRTVALQQLKRVHSETYLASLEQPGAMDNLLGLPMDVKQQDNLLTFQRIMTGGTLRAARIALHRGVVATNLGGGFHHANRNHAAGHCLFNDIAVAIAAVRANGFDDPIVVIDLDLHDGDGTRALFADDPTVHTFSIHNKHLGEIDAVESTSLALGHDVQDDDYLAAVHTHLPPVLQRINPGLVFYLAGADPCVTDKLGNWRVSLEGLLQRDQFVLELLRRDLPTSTARSTTIAGDHNIATVILLAGGYGRQAWRHGAALFSWLLAGNADPDIPPELELPVNHYRRLTRLMRNPQLLPDEQKYPDQIPKGKKAADHFLSDTDWGLNDEDFDLANTPRETRFLGLFNRYGIEWAMEQAGLMDQLRQLGYKDLRLDMDLEDPLGHSLRITTGREPALVLLEVRLRVDRSSRPGLEFLSVEWLLIQDAQVRFEMTRPLLPGQKYPGLGLLRDTAAVLLVLCERLDLDGLAFTPSHFHLSMLAHPMGLCADPEREAVYQAVRRSVKGLHLTEAAQAVDGGQIIDKKTGRPLVWEPAPLIIPVSDTMRQYFKTPDYRDQVSAAVQDLQYEYAPDAPAET